MGNFYFIFSRETRSIPGNELINSDQITQQIGDLFMNLVEILPVDIRNIFFI
jgi:hypothetical protein